MSRFLFILLVFWAQLASASIHKEGDIEWWPRLSKPIGPRSVIVLGFDLDTAGYWDESKLDTVKFRKIQEEVVVFRGLRSKYAAYLITPGEEIRLRVEEIVPLFYQDTLRYAQVLLRPEKPLTVGKHYQLMIRGLEKTHLLLGYFSSYVGVRPPEWDVVDRVHSADSLAWIKKPIQQSKGNYVWSFRADSSTTGSYVRFSYELAIPKQEALVRMTLRQVGSSKTVRRYLTPFKRQLHLGSAQWRQRDVDGFLILADNADYEITFDLLDIFGNELRWQDPPLSFNTRLEK